MFVGYLRLALEIASRLGATPLEHESMGVSKVRGGTPHPSHSTRPWALKPMVTWGSLPSFETLRRWNVIQYWQVFQLEGKYGNAPNGNLIGRMAWWSHFQTNPCQICMYIHHILSTALHVLISNQYVSLSFYMYVIYMYIIYISHIITETCTIDIYLYTWITISLAYENIFLTLCLATGVDGAKLADACPG